LSVLSPRRLAFAIVRTGSLNLLGKQFYGGNGFMSDTEFTLKNRPAAQFATEKIVQEAEPAGLDGLRNTKIPLNNGSDEIPALGFGTLPDRNKRGNEDRA
jgi:hypothetical protein